MNTITSSKVYGTTGIPQFGPTATDTGRSANVEKLNELFNKFMTEVRGITAPGNEIALAKFGAGLEGLYWPAYNCVAGLPVIGNV